jgi:hypothetical protein
MSTVFADSFGHYSTLLTKWDLDGDAQIVDNAALARTNSRFLQIVSGSFGPYKLLPANYTKLIAQVAVKLDGPGPSHFIPAVDLGQNLDYNIRVIINGSGSLSLWRGDGDTGHGQIYETDARPFIWNAWNYIEAVCFFDAVNGSVTLYCNGRLVGSLTGTRTVRQAGSPFTNYVQLLGAPANGTTSYLADFVLLDWDVAPNITPISCAKVYVSVPTANGNPVAWTPSTGANWENVDEIPPDTVTLNTAAVIGTLDQYQHPLTGVPGLATIVAVQHCQCLAVDSGAATVASVVVGTVGAGFGVASTVYAIKCAPLDLNPATVAAWSQASFPVAAGPEVTL